MTYGEAIDFLFNALPVWERTPEAYKPGLERIEAFVDTIGLAEHPAIHAWFSSAGCSWRADRRRAAEDSTRRTAEVGRQGSAPDAPRSRKPQFIHVAGTNGKGSVSHMLAAVLQTAGYRTGLFTSPHLVDFRERIRVDGAMIPEAAVVEFTELYRDEMVRLGLTFFEMATAMALWWFARAGCDIAVMETGLGGRLDSTNIITPQVSVITNIGLEHTQYLGDTIAAIATEKAGIIKRGVPVVVGEADAESEPVFRARAAELCSPIKFSSLRRRSTRACAGEVVENHTLDLAGDYQQKNLATVLTTVDVLRRTMTIPDTALREGLAHTATLTGLQGRWQVVHRAPLVVLDTAHNAHGIADVARQIARQSYDTLYMVLGFAADKDLDTIAGLLPRDAHYILTQADTPRAMPVGELSRRLPFAAGDSAPTVVEAVKRALSLARESDMIFVGGSNFVVAEALREAATFQWL
jgi:dihydrofolate synthase/folylpolyglutamate synthase